MIKLGDLLKVLDFKDYSIWVCSDMGSFELTDLEEIKKHFDYQVIRVNDNHEISIKVARIV